MDSRDDAGYDKPPPNNHLKAIGTVFALLIAPIIAGIIANVGSFFVQKKLEDPADKPQVATAAAAPPAVAIGDKPIAPVASVPSAAVAPVQGLGRAPTPEFQQALDALHAIPVNHLFNGRDLSGFYTYIGPPQTDEKPIGKDKDPDHVFTVKNGVLEISGKEPGTLTTNDEFENYLLTVEYRWGTRTYRPRHGLPKFGAIAFHAYGPDGARRGSWMRGYRARLDENGGGDFGILPHNPPEPHVSVEVEAHIVTTGKIVERTIYTYRSFAATKLFFERALRLAA